MNKSRMRRTVAGGVICCAIPAGVVAMASGAAAAAGSKASSHATPRGMRLASVSGASADGSGWTSTQTSRTNVAETSTKTTMVAETTTTAAATPTVTSTAACYENVNKTRAKMGLIGAGWTYDSSAGAKNTVKLTNARYKISWTATVGDTGVFILPENAPLIAFKKPDDRKITLAVNDATTGQSATASFYVTSLMAAVTPAKAYPDQNVKWAFSGFRSGKQVYGHFIYNGKQSALADYGKAGGPCGTLTATKMMFPGGRPAHHIYGFQIDDTKKYAKTSTPRITSTFVVQSS